MLSPVAVRTKDYPKIFLQSQIFFLQRPPTHAVRLDFDAIASAIEFYIILRKILAETVY